MRVLSWIQAAVVLFALLAQPGHARNEAGPGREGGRCLRIDLRIEEVGAGQTWSGVVTLEAPAVLEADSADTAVAEEAPGSRPEPDAPGSLGDWRAALRVVARVSVGVVVDWLLDAAGSRGTP